MLIIQSPEGAGTTQLGTQKTIHKQHKKNKSRSKRETIQLDVNIPGGKINLIKWLNKNFRIEMTDGRILVGVFLCTDRDANVILGSCSEYLSSADMDTEEPRVLGLVMVPGRHIVSIKMDDTAPLPKYYVDE